MKYFVCAVLMVIALSSYGAIPQKPAEFVRAVFKDATEPVQSAGWEKAEMQITLKIGETAFAVELEDNETAAAFAKRLPMTMTMEELNGNEKYVYLNDPLPASSAVPGGIQAGDVMLYGDSCLVVFYESFSTSYSYTPIGHIADTAGLKSALGNDSVSVAWEFE